MTYVITERCVGIKDTSCVESCPVDAIRPTLDDEDFDDVDHLFIDPATCIDCGACVPACPSDAVFAEQDVPEQWRGYIAKNAEHFSKAG